MKVKRCPYCESQDEVAEGRTKVVKFGFFRRKSDSKKIQKYFCQNCLRSFSNATSHPCFKQRKRHVNEKLRRLLCSGVSQRRAARLLNVNRKTVVRKFLFLGQRALQELEAFNKSKPLCETIEFDEMETFEHTKCKPLSIPLVVEFESRRILGFSVAQMPSKGKLSKIALKKYGPRKDERVWARKDLFQRIKPLVKKEAFIKSDQNPHYPNDIKVSFPKARHETFKGQRGSIVGQGELKKVRFDPLFSLNHTCAMLRANINRLFRKTWCTTKVPQRLYYHIAIYALYHNLSLGP